MIQGVYYLCDLICSSAPWPGSGGSAPRTAEDLWGEWKSTTHLNGIRLMAAWAFISRLRQQLRQSAPRTRQWNEMEWNVRYRPERTQLSSPQCCLGGKPRSGTRNCSATEPENPELDLGEGVVTVPTVSTSLSSGDTAQKGPTGQEPGAPEPRGEGNPSTRSRLDRSSPASPAGHTRAPACCG